MSSRGLSPRQNRMLTNRDKRATKLVNGRPVCALNPLDLKTETYIGGRGARFTVKIIAFVRINGHRAIPKARPGPRVAWSK